MDERENQNPFVSLIIPAYNAAPFIETTVHSVLQQTYQNWELLIVNDGSTDSTVDLISAYIDDARVRIFNKENTGVSDSRNTGLKYTTGEYVVFLDADDVLYENFLEKRVEALTLHPEYAMCCSYTRVIDAGGKSLSGMLRGSSENMLQEVMNYDLDVITCPSNYMIRRKFLMDHTLGFNATLQSTADRFFLIQASFHGKCFLIENDAWLLYRKHFQSMSNYLTTDLVQDKIRYLELVRQLKNIPSSLKRSFIYKTSFYIGGAFWKLKIFQSFLKYMFRCFLINPPQLIKDIATRLNRDYTLN